MGRNSVGSRALRISLLASSAFLLLSAASLSILEHRRRLSDVEADVGALYAAQAPGLAEALWDYDSDLVRVLVDGLRLYPFINYAAVTDDRGARVEGGERKAGSLVRSFPLARAREGGEPSPVGELLLEIDYGKIAAEVRGQVLASVALQALLILASSSIVILLFERMVTRHLATIASRMEGFDLGAGGPPLAIDKRELGDELDTLVRAFNSMRGRIEAADASARRAMGELSRSLQEKEVLLQEVYHRTKNNMQLIAAFLSLQAGESEDEGVRAMLEEMIGRIASMALVHKKLYESRDLSRIELGDYLRELVEEIRRAFLAERGGIGISVQAEGGIVSVLDFAVPCGLAVNELVVNAVKHAFPGGRGGSIRVGLRKAGDGAIELTVSDDGIGLPPGFDPGRDGKIGLRTVASLVESQLRGKLALGTGPGVSWRASLREDFLCARL